MHNDERRPEDSGEPDREATGRRRARDLAMPDALPRHGVDRSAVEEDLERTLLSIVLDAVIASDAVAGALCIRAKDDRLELGAFFGGSDAPTPAPELETALRGMKPPDTLPLFEQLGEGPRHVVWQGAVPPYVIVRSEDEDATNLDVWLFPFWRSGQVAGFVELGLPRGGELSDTTREAVTALTQQAGLAIEKPRTAGGPPPVSESAALQRAAKLTEANAALQRSLDVFASETDVDRFLAHILAEIGGRLSAQRIVLWLAEGEQAPTIGSRLCWAEGHVSEGTIEGLLGPRAAAALMQGANWFRQLRLPLLRATRECSYLTAEEARALEDAGVRSILHLPLILGECFLGAVSVLFDTEVVILAEDLNLVQAFAHQITLAIRLAQLSMEAQNAAITRERARISREIHDTTIQTFIGMIRHLKGHEGRPPNVEAALSLAESGLGEARRAVAAMRPSLLEGKPFVDAVRDMATAMTAENLRVAVTSSGTPMNLMPESEGNLFRIVQEAVNNVVNHAGATEVAIEVSFLPGELTVLVSDNGRGFDVGSVDQEHGFGLFSMKQRAQAIGAELVVVSEPGKGTQVYVSWHATSSE